VFRPMDVRLTMVHALAVAWWAREGLSTERSWVGDVWSCVTRGGGSWWGAKKVGAY